MTSPQPIVAKTGTAAKMLDVSPGQFRKFAKKADFPDPSVIHGIKYWLTADLKAWCEAYFENPDESDTLPPHQETDEFDKGVINLAEKANGRTTGTRSQGKGKG